MDAFTNLEKKVEKLIVAYQALQSRVAELEEENGRLKTTSGGSDELARRVGELEAERSVLRERLSGLMEKLDEIQLQE